MCEHSFELEWELVQTAYLLSSDIVVIVDVDWNERQFQTEQASALRDLSKLSQLKKSYFLFFCI